MARHGKAYSKRSTASQRRIDHQIVTHYGDTKSARERALRDLRERKWTPFARTAERRTPKRFTPPIGGKFGPSRADLEDAYVSNMRNQVGYFLKFNLFRVRHRATELTDDDLIWGANATEEEIIERGTADALAAPKRVSPGFYH